MHNLRQVGCLAVLAVACAVFPLLAHAAPTKQTGAGDSATEENAGGATATSVVAKGQAWAKADPIFAAFDEGNYVAARELAEKAVARGDGTAAALLGRIYAEGLGVATDLEKAIAYYRSGSEAGNVHATFALAMMLLDGNGVPRDRALAANLLEAASAGGVALASYNLALLYLKGDGRPFDAEKAAGLLERAAREGHAPAQYDLGQLFMLGEGVPVDQAKAAAWIGKAAERGHVDAQAEYGIMLFVGRGVEKNPEQGAWFIRSAAEKGNPVAQNRLAHLYVNGIAVPRDLVEAAKWHLLARAQGASDMRLDILVTQIPEADRVKASELAVQWQADRRSLR